MKRISFAELKDRVIKVIVLALTAAAVMVFGTQAEAQTRIRDLTTVSGVRSNPVYGYGIVIGLDGTGDQTTQTPFTSQSIVAMLQQSGITLPPGANMQLKNVASVMVTANLPAFVQPGQAIDVTVSSIGNAKSLRGGMLLMTPLKGADGQVYALAQGQLIVGGETLQLELNSTDFSNSIRVAEAINASMGPNVAQALDGRIIKVRAPSNPNDRVAFLSRVQELSINKSVGTAKVIVNARTGSVVMNQAVMLESCAVAHGNLTVKITSTPVISQPAPFSQGQTVVAEQADIQISESGGELIEIKGAAQLSDVVKALNALGATPSDLISILQAMQTAGSLKAELEVI
jgi:flagellar P-ring protein FlgI